MPVVVDVCGRVIGPMTPEEARRFRAVIREQFPETRAWIRTRFVLTWADGLAAIREDLRREREEFGEPEEEPCLFPRK